MTQTGAVVALMMTVTGCSGLTAVAHVDSPARIPLETFPTVYLASLSSPDPGADQLGALLVEALAKRSTQVQTVAVDQLEEQRLQGRILSPSIVVTLQLSFRSGLATRQVNDPQTVCGPSGCITRRRNRTVNVPTLQGQLIVRVYDGPTARPLQQVQLTSERQVGGVDVLLRDRVMLDLRQRLVAAITTRRVSQSVRLVRLDLPAAEPALEDLAAGRWRQGRARLERLRDEADALPNDERAAYYYDLGIARRFDPRSLSENPELHFRQAEEALRRAVQLDPRTRYALALREMQEHRVQIRLVQQQRAAAEHNFSLEPRQGRPPPSPSPPPGYGQN